MKKLYILFVAVLLAGCANTPEANIQRGAEALAYVAATESPSDAAALKEISTGLGLLCGQGGPIDKATILKLLKEKIGGRTSTRLGALVLLLDDFETDTSNTQWGEAACKLSAGINRGLQLAGVP